MKNKIQHTSAFNIVDATQNINNNKHVKQLFLRIFLFYIVYWKEIQITEKKIIIKQKNTKCYRKHIF